MTRNIKMRHIHTDAMALLEHFDASCRYAMQSERTVHLSDQQPPFFEPNSCWNAQKL